MTMRIRSGLVLPLVLGSIVAQNGFWASLGFPASPGGRYGSSLVYDSARDRLVLVGGTPSGSNETWENDGSSWVLRATSGPTGSALWYPSPFLRATYDSQRQRTVLVQTDSTLTNMKTWEWNGSVWNLRTNGTVPPVRAGFALAYDALRGRTVMFGGYSPATEHLSDTWEWDGASWQQLGAGGPSARQLAAMAFDAASGTTVLFGGRHTTSPYATYGDTWEWNGVYWLEHFGVGGPSARQTHSMAFDAARSVIVLYGGNNPGAGGGDYADTWEWDGSQWVDRQATTASSAWTALAHDSARQRTIMFGGLGPTGLVSNQTLAYTVTTHVATITPYGTGCAGPTGVPLLAALPGSVPRFGSTMTLQLSNLPAGVLNIPVGWLGFDNATWGGLPLPLPLDPAGFPGCTALLAPGQAFALTNNGGTATWSLAIPFLPAFAGLQFYLQGGVLVLGFNPGGLVFTRGLAGTVGH